MQSTNYLLFSQHVSQSSDVWILNGARYVTSSRVFWQSDLKVIIIQCEISNEKSWNFREITFSVFFSLKILPGWKHSLEGAAVVQSNKRPSFNWTLAKRHHLFYLMFTNTVCGITSATFFYPLFPLNLYSSLQLLYY